MENKKTDIFDDDFFDDMSENKNKKREEVVSEILKTNNQSPVQENQEIIEQPEDITSNNETIEENADEHINDDDIAESAERFFDGQDEEDEIPDDDNVDDEETEDEKLEKELLYAPIIGNKTDNDKSKKVNPPDEKKDKTLLQQGLIILAVFAVVAALVLCIKACSRNNDTNIPDNNDPAITTPNTDENGKNDDDLVDIGGGNIEYPNITDYNVADMIEQVMPAMVSLQSEKNYGMVSRGSGVIIGDNGEFLWIATNFHVIDLTQRLLVTFNTNEVAQAYINGYDADDDIAIISVKFTDLSEDTLSKVRAVKLGDSSKMRIGEHVVAVGNSLGYGQSATTGIISATDRTIPFSNGLTKVLQVSAPINHGSSGGALLNLAGELVGITTAKYEEEGTEGVGYCIPISNVLTDIQTFCAKDGRRTTGERVQCGISISDVGNGVLVLNINEGSPAYNSEMHAGDIIVGINDRVITRYDEFENELLYYKSGDTITVTANRANGKTFQTVKYTLTFN